MEPRLLQRLTSKEVFVQFWISASDRDNFDTATKVKKISLKWLENLNPFITMGDFCRQRAHIRFLTMGDFCRQTRCTFSTADNLCCVRPLLFILIQLESSCSKLYNDVRVKGGHHCKFPSYRVAKFVKNSSKFSSNPAAVNELYALESLGFPADFDSQKDSN